MLPLFIVFSFCFLSTIAEPSVIIIGAGPAGIAAATKLLENSVTNITILEAEGRIGGRINSIKFGDGIVDLGAQYCHGQKSNIAYEMAKEWEILEPSVRGFDKVTKVYYSNGSELNSELVERLREVYTSYHTGNVDNFNGTGKSVGDLMTYKYANLLNKYKDDRGKINILNDGLRFIEGYVVIHEGVFSWFDTSAKCDYKQCEGNQGLIWKKLGYNAILQIMMKSYPDVTKKLPIDDKIHLNTKVEKISWNESASVYVSTTNGNYSADFVVFTSSIGVLKNNKDTLFDPPLPQLKQEAIEATGFAGVMKIFFSFSTKWWKDDDQAFSFFWSEQDLNSVQERWIAQFRYILKVPDNPDVWVGWVSGNLVPEIEEMPLETVKAGCQAVFNRFLGKDYNVSEISQIITSDWCTNDNFRGTYSYTKAGFYKQGLSYQKILSEPLGGVTGRPTLLFAGEATNPVHYSTVHGAIETGYREAARIINFSKKYNDY